MTTENPFPGMNPFLERHWSDIHTSLISYIRDALAEQMPPGLNARSEERVTLYSADDDGGALRPDVAVIEPWRTGQAPRWEPGAATEGERVAVAEPERIPVCEETERWIEIRDANGLLITVIEVLSPTNKGEGAEAYRSRQAAYIHSRVNLVEIDLLRAGAHVLAVPAAAVKPRGSVRYLICVTRAAAPAIREVYRLPLREPLPNIRIPLRKTDPDAILRLQPLINRCYRMGGYWSADHRNVPEPALPEDDAKWVADVVAAAARPTA